MLKRLSLVALAGVTLLGSLPAGAQYYDPYRGPPRGEYYERGPRRDFDDGYRRPRYDDERRRPRYDDDRSYRPQRSRGGICVTSRGNCPTSLPRGSNCRCDIPGFGPKRGGVQ
ncbi:MAG: hypothetical protein K2Z25_24410 [Beijerinckiaceae bacterium]|nr:hypothetical protein [Beijerinckiaceae bacterium]